MKSLVGIALFLGACVVITYEQLASYRSRAVCVSLLNNDNSYQSVDLRHFETQTEDGVKTVVFVHKGAIPSSQYWCSVIVQNEKVTRAQNSHEWTF